MMTAEFAGMLSKRPVLRFTAALFFLLIQYYFYSLKHVVAFFVMKFLCQKQRQNFKFFRSKFKNF